jgi:two-component system sensor histidine kinase TorS
MFFTLIVTVWAVFRYHLLGRLNGMETAVRALSTGDYDVTIATGDQDPLAPLGRALEQFRENARERLRLEDELRRHQQVLESQVAERTAELKHSNALLAREVAEHAVARQVAEEANKAKGVFLGTLSHELRTPLSGVLGIVRLLRESPLDSRQRQYLDTIGYANLTLLEILEDMLSFSRIEAGKLDLQREPFYLRETIDDMLSLQSVQDTGKGIAVIRDVAAEVPRLVVGDRRSSTSSSTSSATPSFTDEGSVTVSVVAAPAEAGARPGSPSPVCDTGTASRPTRPPRCSNRSSGRGHRPPPARRRRPGPGDLPAPGGGDGRRDLAGKPARPGHLRALQPRLRDRRQPASPRRRRCRPMRRAAAADGAGRRGRRDQPPGVHPLSRAAGPPAAHRRRRHRSP